MKTKELNNWTHESRINTYDWCTPAYSIVYSYILSRFIWFREEGLPYFEKQESIADATGVGVLTVKRAIKLFEANALVHIKKVKTQSYLKNQYTVVDKFGTYSRLPKKPLVAPVEDAPDW